jgi:hypothetical protein
MHRVKLFKVNLGASKVIPLNSCDKKHTLLIKEKLLIVKVFNNML